MNRGIVIFSTLTEALRAGYQVESPHPNDEGFLRARLHTENGWARALVRV